MGGNNRGVGANEAQKCGAVTCEEDGERRICDEAKQRTTVVVPRPELKAAQTAAKLDYEAKKKGAAKASRTAKAARTAATAARSKFDGPGPRKPLLATVVTKETDATAAEAQAEAAANEESAAATAKDTADKAHDEAAQAAVVRKHCERHAAQDMSASNGTKQSFAGIPEVGPASPWEASYCAAGKQCKRLTESRAPTTHYLKCTSSGHKYCAWPAEGGATDDEPPKEVDCVPESALRSTVEAVVSCTECADGDLGHEQSRWAFPETAMIHRKKQKEDQALAAKRAAEAEILRLKLAASRKAAETASEGPPKEKVKKDGTCRVNTTGLFRGGFITLTTDIDGPKTKHMGPYAIWGAYKTEVVKMREWATEGHVNACQPPTEVGHYVASLTRQAQVLKEESERDDLKDGVRSLLGDIAANALIAGRHFVKLTREYSVAVACQYVEFLKLKFDGCISNNEHGVAAEDIHQATLGLCPAYQVYGLNQGCSQESLVGAVSWGQDSIKRLIGVSSATVGTSAAQQQAPQATSSTVASLTAELEATRAKLANVKKEAEKAASAAKRRNPGAPGQKSPKKQTVTPSAISLQQSANYNKKQAAIAAGGSGLNCFRCDRLGCKARTCTETHKADGTVI